ncbi:MAG: helix-turn-helix transcriptional regulator [Acidaminococcaceae bacterium]|nr:helix-turn-helix transcriptional regulator [Acidaminococcaceae bacterium]
MFSVKKFKLLLIDSGMNIKEFAEVSGVSAVAIGQILNHKAKPTLPTVGKIAKGLKVSAAELLTDE